MLTIVDNVSFFEYNTRMETLIVNYISHTETLIALVIIIANIYLSLKVTNFFVKKKRRVLIKIIVFCVAFIVIHKLILSALVYML